MAKRARMTFRDLHLCCTPNYNRWAFIKKKCTNSAQGCTTFSGDKSCNCTGMLHDFPAMLLFSHVIVMTILYSLCPLRVDDSLTLLYGQMLCVFSNYVSDAKGVQTMPSRVQGHLWWKGKRARWQMWLVLHRRLLLSRRNDWRRYALLSKIITNIYYLYTNRTKWELRRIT